MPARREGPEESLREFGNRRLGAGFTSVFLDAIPGLYLNCNAYRGIAMNDCARNSRELAARITRDYQAMP